MTMVIGGAVAGLAGVSEVTGIQGRLQSGISVQYGYIGFLASWLAGTHRSASWPRRCCSARSPSAATACKSAPRCPLPA